MATTPGNPPYPTQEGHPTLKRGGSPGRPKGGRPRGSKNKVSRSLKASIRRIYEELLAEEPENFKARIRKGLLGKRGLESVAHVKLAAAYLDGLPVQEVRVRERQVVKIIMVAEEDEIPG